MAQGMFNSSIGRKFAMAISALFLVVFLIVHLLINMLSVISPEMFNEASHFMGTNPFIQFFFQPILILGVLFHLTMGVILELKNRKARGSVRYVKNNSSSNSSWMSRNMIWTGLIVEAFILIHMAGFWWHEMKVKYISPETEDPGRYYGELVEYFENPVKVAIYVLAFVFLALHLMHGFQSAFQSSGVNHRKYTPAIKQFGNIYAIVIPLGFIFIAVYHFINH